MRRHLIGLACVAASVAGLLAYRAWFVEPRAWAALCVAAASPSACVPRGWLLWLQHFGLWGGAALALGLAAFRGAPFAVSVAAVALGVAGVVNYNASFGMLGLALGGWAWLNVSGGTAAGRPAPARTGSTPSPAGSASLR